jgi:hypothetical protein
MPLSCIEADSVLLPSNGDRHKLRGQDGPRTCGLYRESQAFVRN